VPTLAAHLVRDYGHSLAEKNLRRMVQFAAIFSDEPIVVTLSRQMSWSHFVALLPLKDPLQREYYAQMCCAERRSVRTLRGRIDSMLYERTALSRQPTALIAQELARSGRLGRDTPRRECLGHTGRVNPVPRFYSSQRAGSLSVDVRVS
jgi:hypothetical protein